MDQPRAAIEEAGVRVRVCALNLWESDSCLPKLQEPPGVLEEHLGVLDANFRPVVRDSFSLLFVFTIPVQQILHLKLDLT